MFLASTWLLDLSFGCWSLDSRRRNSTHAALDLSRLESLHIIAKCNNIVDIISEWLKQFSSILINSHHWTFQRAPNGFRKGAKTLLSIKSIKKIYRSLQAPAPGEDWGFLLKFGLRYIRFWSCLTGPSTEPKGQACPRGVKATKFMLHAAGSFDIWKSGVWDPPRWLRRLAMHCGMVMDDD